MTNSKDIQVTPYYRFLYLTMIGASCIVFVWLAVQLWYVLRPDSGLAILSAGIAFFAGTLWYQRQANWRIAQGILCWLAWLVWSVIAGLSCTIYSAHFLDRSAFSGNPDALIAAIPFMAGFMPIMALTAFLAVARVLWPLPPRKKLEQSATEVG